VHDVGTSFGLYDPDQGRKLREENAVVTLQSWVRGCNVRSSLAKEKKKETGMGHGIKSSQMEEGIHHRVVGKRYDESSPKPSSSLGAMESTQHKSSDDTIVDDSIVDEVDVYEDDTMDERNPPQTFVDPVMEMEKEIRIQEQQPSRHPIAINLDGRDHDKHSHRDPRGLSVDIAVDPFTIVRVIQKKYLQKQLQVRIKSSSPPPSFCFLVISVSQTDVLV
jgi:hypothetical protein